MFYYKYTDEELARPTRHLIKEPHHIAAMAGIGLVQPDSAVQVKFWKFHKVEHLQGKAAQRFVPRIQYGHCGVVGSSAKIMLRYSRGNCLKKPHQLNVLLHIEP